MIDDNNIDNTPNEDALDETFKLLFDILDTIKQNQDNRTKEVGDKIIIWDGSYNICIEEGRHYSGTDLNDHECIVVSTNESFIGEDKYSGVNLDNDIDSLIFTSTHPLDLIVYSKKYNKHIRTSSDFVKIV